MPLFLSTVSPKQRLSMTSNLLAGYNNLQTQIFGPQMISHADKINDTLPRSDVKSLELCFNSKIPFLDLFDLDITPPRPTI